MNKHEKIYVAGHTGLVGSAIVRKLQADGYNNLILRTKKELDLRNQMDVNLFFRQQQPEYVFITAALVGGIKANNTRRAEFIYDNLMIQSNVIHAAYVHEVKKLLFTGSACIYPKFASQPINEEQLLAGALEPTNEPYAVAKIAGIKMCQAYRSQYGCDFIAVMPTNTYGLNDKYDLENCHVLPALLRKIITAKETNQTTIELWGTGMAAREFIYVDDMADAIVFLMKMYDDPEIVNIGTGEDILIKELAQGIKSVVGWKGSFVFNFQLDGVMKRLLDVSKLKGMGWRYKTSLMNGIQITVDDIYDSKKYLPWLQ